jgi:hypothetical protein
LLITPDLRCLLHRLAGRSSDFLRALGSSLVCAVKALLLQLKCLLNVLGIVCGQGFVAKYPISPTCGFLGRA